MAIIYYGIVGYVVIGGQHGLRIAYEKKPRLLTRFLLRILLEIEWEDIKDVE